MGNVKMKPEELQSVFLTNLGKRLLPPLNLRPIQFIVFYFYSLGKYVFSFPGHLISRQICRPLHNSD